MAGVRESWDRIIQWHRTHVTDDGDPVLFAPPPAASEEGIARAEHALGHRLPDDLRASYRMHDGSGRYGIFPWGYRFLSVAELAGEWHRNQSLLSGLDWDARPAGPIRPVYWSAGWVPVGSNDSGDYDCVDLDPGPGGTLAQVIQFNHEVGPTRVAAASFGSWLARYADLLEAGVYRYDPDSLWVCRDDGDD
jgi:cell wall assembly regulator SMI1